MLDDRVDDVIDIISPFITDSIWIGKPNQLIQRLSLNGHGDAKTINRAKRLLESLSDDYILDLYSSHKDNPLIKWKDGVKKIVGIEAPNKPGLDV